MISTVSLYFPILCKEQITVHNSDVYYLPYVPILQF